MNRRGFLKLGLFGSAALAVGGTWVVWRDLNAAHEGGPPRDRVALVVGAIAPVMLAGALPADSAQRADGVARVVKDVKAMIGTFPADVQHELADLFGLLDIAIVRRLLARVSSDWSHAKPDEITAFLERWRTSRFGTLQIGYFALHDLILGAWYADQASWAAIGYPGPPNVE